MNIELLLTGFDPSNIPVVASIAPLLLGALIAGAVSLAVGIYTFLQMRKMQKKNRPKPNQLDGTIADEGISFYDLAGSPHVHANITDIWDKSTKAIKKKSGGFLGIGSTSQVTGYRYYAKFAAFIGNRIEKLLAINFDNRKWVLHDPEKHPPNLLPVLEGNLFGENEGGVSGNVDIHFGDPDQEPNAEYQKYLPLVSGYPYQSYLVFRGLGEVKTSGGLIGGVIGSLQAHRHDSFYLGNSGYMKEMLLWVKRTRVRNDGREQWYEVRDDWAVVCEIGARELVIASQSKSNTPAGSLNLNYMRYTKHDNATLQGTLGEMDYWPSHDMEWYFSNPISNRLFINTSLIPSDSLEIKESIIIGRQSLPICVFEITFTSIGDMSYTLSGNVVEVISISDESHEWVSNTDPSRTKVIKVAVKLDNGLEVTQQVKNPETRFEDLILGSGIKVKLIDFLDEYWTSKLSAEDINPIHKIREILTDDTAMGKPETDVNDVNFMKAADRIYDEGLGVSWAIDEKLCIDAIEELCYHIEAGIRVNRQTGLYEMVLFRDNWFSENEIHDIPENKIKDLSLEVMNSDDIVNQLNITYYDRERTKNSTFSIYENGSILTMGHANAESVEFPYFMNIRNAEIVANWKLKQFSTPAWSGSFTTGWREAREWNRYDLIRLPWSKKWNGTILVRIMKINLGNGVDNTVTIDFEEVIPYLGEMNTSIVVDESMEEKPLSPQPAIAEVFESPYYFNVLQLGERQVRDELIANPDFGIIFAAALKNQWNSMNAKIVSIAVNRPDDGWLDEGYLDYSSGGVFLEPVIQTQKFIPVGNLQTEDELKPGQLIFVGQWLTGSQEFMIFKSYDANTGIMQVERGALDTVPLCWDRVNFFIIDTPFVGDFYYTSMDKVRASVLPTTPSGILEHLGSSSVEMNSRAIRPYVPANVKINGRYYPETIIVINDLTLTWAGRNRLANQIIDFFNDESNAEVGTTYSYELLSENVVLDSMAGISTNTTTILSSVLIPNKPHTLRLWSVRDGYESHQVFEHSFFAESASLILSASADSSKVIGNTVPAANISVNVDTSLKANIQFDGSGIKGKTLPNSIITIEVE